MSSRRINELAKLIATHTEKLDTYLVSQNLPLPSFDADYEAPLVLDGDVASSRQIILEATDELHALVNGPYSILTTMPVRILWNPVLLHLETLM